MRRTDREIKSTDKLIQILKQCDVCRLAFADGGVPYVVPMNFGFEYADGKFTFYFHGAGEGRKHDIIKANPVACFEADCAHKLITGGEACNYTMAYESVVGTGNVSYCTGRAEKARALTLLMKQYEPGKPFSFPDRAVDAITIFKLEIFELSGKSQTSQ